MRRQAGDTPHFDWQEIVKDGAVSVGRDRRQLAAPVRRDLLVDELQVARLARKPGTGVHDLAGQGAVAAININKRLSSV